MDNIHHNNSSNGEKKFACWHPCGLVLLVITTLVLWSFGFVSPPVSEASREVANIIERKICIPPYLVSKNSILMYGPSNGCWSGCFSGCRCADEWLRLYASCIKYFLLVWPRKCIYLFLFNLAAIPILLNLKTRLDRFVLQKSILENHYYKAPIRHSKFFLFCMFF